MCGGGTGCPVLIPLPPHLDMRLHRLANPCPPPRSEGFHNVGYSNNLDAQLTERGWDQAHALGRHMRGQAPTSGVQLVVVSPLVRALETAAGVFGLDPGQCGSEPPTWLMAEQQADRNVRTAHGPLALRPGLQFVAQELCRERLGEAAGARAGLPLRALRAAPVLECAPWVYACARPAAPKLACPLGRAPAFQQGPRSVTGGSRLKTRSGSSREWTSGAPSCRCCCAAAAQLLRSRVFLRRDLFACPIACAPALAAACPPAPVLRCRPCSLIESPTDASWQAGRVESESNVVVRGFNFLAWLMQARERAGVGLRGMWRAWRAGRSILGAGRCGGSAPGPGTDGARLQQCPALLCFGGWGRRLQHGWPVLSQRFSAPLSLCYRPCRGRRPTSPSSRTLPSSGSRSPASATSLPSRCGRTCSGGTR